MLRITQIQINYRLKIPVALRAPYAVVVKRCHHMELNTDPHTLLQIHHKKTKTLLNIVHYCDNHQVSITCNNITISSNIHLCVELKKKFCSNLTIQLFYYLFAVAVTLIEGLGSTIGNEPESNCIHWPAERHSTVGLSVKNRPITHPNSSVGGKTNRSVCKLYTNQQ